MKKTLAAVIAALAMQAPPAHAITVVGTPSCGTWVAERAKNDWLNVKNIAWLVGYLTGMAVATDVDALKNTDNESLYLWMDNWCRGNPLKNVSEGGVELFKELAKRR
ncbi:hypothetical protein [Cupriavidus consociatus]|uniref:hypothetical protein n=1 Tax=Cupriavidus consociatus TaxID=2821357 RepID=UPI001AEB6C1B|nr:MULTISPECIES: hypothetical protein [unclassified Cupriavidus]MBP0624006.1 hypothetical protein [Cupriavidus sp. LEh25]MDK2660715.1 hypothetical protein [Cupriavidus sp. LEh21]